MSQTEKSGYYQALKASGLHFDRPYREYTTAELKESYERLRDAGAAAPLDLSAPEPEPRYVEPADPQAAAFFGFTPPVPPDPITAVAHEANARNVSGPPPPVMERNPDEMAGQRLNVKDIEEPIRTDESGRVWLQEEVRKPAYPKPRGRRVLKYMDPGVEKKVVKSGDYIEEFEVAGDPANARPAEVKITLPSYQVGIYRDPRFPFKVVCYNDNEGFDLMEVRDFYGGAELVPADVKLKYVENTLCYDMRSVIRAIEAEYRQKVLGQRA